MKVIYFCIFLVYVFGKLRDLTVNSLVLDLFFKRIFVKVGVCHLKLSILWSKLLNSIFFDVKQTLKIVLALSQMKDLLRGQIRILILRRITMCRCQNTFVLKTSWRLIVGARGVLVAFFRNLRTFTCEKLLYLWAWHIVYFL